MHHVSNGFERTRFYLPNLQAMLRSLALSIAVWLIASSTPALAQTASPPPDAADVTYQWVQAVADQDYSTAWALLTVKSQDYIVNAVANDQKLDPAEVRVLFDRTDPSIVAGFWTSFRKSASLLPKLAGANPSVVSSHGDVAIVQFYGYNQQWMCFREAGGWRVGFIETFHPN